MEHIVEYAGLSLMIALFEIGYMRDGYLEGIKLASYSASTIVMIALAIYIFQNQKLLKKIIDDPSYITPELYAYLILLVISFVFGISIEKYVEYKKKTK